MHGRILKSPKKYFGDSSEAHKRDILIKFSKCYRARTRKRAQLVFWIKTQKIMIRTWWSYQKTSNYLRKSSQINFRPFRPHPADPGRFFIFSSFQKIGNFSGVPIHTRNWFLAKLHFFVHFTHIWALFDDIFWQNKWHFSSNKTTFRQNERKFTFLGQKNAYFGIEIPFLNE